MSTYEVFQRARPKWFAVNVIFRFGSPAQQGSEVYDARGGIISTEATHDRSFGPKEQGGLIVFSTTSRTALLLPRLKGRVLAFLQSWKKRWKSFSKIARFGNRLRRRKPTHKDLWFSVGCFYQGKYWSPDPYYMGKDFSLDRQVYDDTCLAIEIRGITQAVLIELATALARDFDQRVLLVFDNAAGAIFTIDRR